MDIDLGQEVVFNVKLGGQEYRLAEPSVSHVKKFQDKLKDNDEISAFLFLIEELGLPKDVCGKLSVTQIKKLSEGIMGGISEKK